MSSTVQSSDKIELIDDFKVSEKESLISTEDEEICVICYEKIHTLNKKEIKPFKKKVKAIFLKKEGCRYFYINKCKHYFHQDCLLDWFETCKGRRQKQNCPTCRTVVKKVKKPGCWSYF